MIGIFTGMKITLKHLLSPKVTRLYPYQKRVMPPRMRGLIHYLRDADGRFKCEGCLLCEKVCPPQAITVQTRPRQTHRDRPLTLEHALWGNFRRSRRSLLSHQGRPEQALDQRSPRSGEPPIDWARIRAILDDASRPGAGLVPALAQIQSTVGHLPRHAVVELAAVSGVDLSTVYGVATGIPGLQARTVPDKTVAVCQCPVCRNAGAVAVAKAIAPDVAAAGLALADSKPHGRCLGDVRQAPVVRIGDRSFGAPTVDAARQVIREYSALGGAPR